MGSRFCLILIALVLCRTAGAQTSECDENLRHLHKLVSTGKNGDAFTMYSQMGKCDLSSDQAYFDVEQVLNFKISISNAEEKQKYIDALIALYDNDEKAKPKNNHGNLVKKATLLKNNKLGTDEEIFLLLDKAYKNDKANFSDPKALYTYFALYVDRYKSGKHKITDEDVLQLQDDVSANLRKLSYLNSNPRNYNSALSGIRALAAPVSTCDKLTPYYNKNFKAKKDDADWMQSATNTLFGKNCTADSIFLKFANRAYELQPSSKTAYNAGIGYMRNKNMKKAVELFKISADLEKDPTEKAQTLYMISTSVTSTDKAMALDYAKKSLLAKPNFGKAYLHMARIYSGALDCGKTTFEKKALNLLASQTALKAAEVDPAFKSAADRQSEMFLKQGPTGDEIKQEKMAGKKITFGCYINESVVIPKS